MKTTHFFHVFLLFLFPVIINAQQGINYKAIIHNDNGDPLANTLITIEFAILENGILKVYEETHTPTTDNHGIIVVTIGTGTVVLGDFDMIVWRNNPHFLRTRVDMGNGYSDMGTTEFSFVPYAHYASWAESAWNIEGPITENQNLADVLSRGSDANNNTISNLADPANGQDAVTKSYVDQLETRISQLEAIIANYIDKDGDGRTVLIDCNDNDPFVYPGAPEICDEKDNDCNEVIDDKDSDNDGYFDNECGGTDCDDNDPQINPGVSEVCGNGIDEDCSGLVDDKDLDNDGVVDIQCGGADCNDSDPTIYPGAQEVQDGKDNDCDGYVDEGIIPEGTVILTEIMYDPSAVSDVAGEWVEVFNAGTNPVNLHGFRISDNGVDDHTINEPSGLLLAPGGSAVLCSNIDPLTNGGVSCDYQWGNFQLSNTDDEFILDHSGIEISRIEYNESTTWPTAVGESLNLDPNNYDALSNQNGANWCITPNDDSYKLSGGDYGTPGVINPSCTGAPAIVSVVPDNGIPAGGEAITLQGSGFTGTTSVQIGPLACPSFNVVDDSEIICVTPAQNSGDYNLVVIIGAESGTLENGFRYTSSTGSRIDWAALQYPSALTTDAGSSTWIFGRVYEPGITPGGGIDMLAQVGFGPYGSDPTTDPGWLWYPAEWNPACMDCGPNDEYMGSLVFPSAGTYNYAYRFSEDGGYTFLYADFDPGSADGFNISDMGIATIQ